MKNYFETPFKGKPLSEQVKNPNIKVGRYSYYSGYYHVTHLMIVRAIFYQIVMTLIN